MPGFDSEPVTRQRGPANSREMIDAGYAVPRLVGSEIWTLPNQYRWRTIASAPSAFVEDLGLEKVQAAE